MTQWLRASVSFTALLLLTAGLALPVQAAPNRVYSAVLAEGTSGTTDRPLQASFRGPEGVEIRSYSTKWTRREDLKAVYDELLQNLHGPEIKKLGAVNLYPDGSGGLYHSELLQSFTGRDVADGRSIDLFGVDTMTLDELARTLAHEYGHHFTFYYRWVKEGASFQYWKEGGWADARRLRDNLSVTANSTEHGWLPAEIAAEDYAQLFGSPRARQSTAFSEATRYFANDMHNLDPQENLTLPLAAEISGYKDYWLKLSGLSVPADSPPSRPWLQVLGEESSGGRRYVNLRWSGAADPDGRPLEYTIVSYSDPLRLPYGYLTVTDRTEARIRVSATGTHTTFRLFVKDAGNNTVSSQPVPVDLSQPVAATATSQDLPERVRLSRPAAVARAPFWDLARSSWYASSVDLITAAGVMKGYPDGTFAPDAPVRRAEFLAVLLRAYPQAAAKGAPFDDVWTGHWAYALISQARGLGLVTGDQNQFKPDGYISRAEMATMLHRVLELDRPLSSPAFPDIAGRPWARDAIETLAGYGLLLGSPGERGPVFKPDELGYRSQVAVLLSRLVRK